MSLFAELKRRNVIRMAMAYAVLGWLLTEVSSVVMPAFGAPGWVMKVLIYGVVLGFGPALVFSWVYELTPAGIKKAAEIDHDDSITVHTAKKLDVAVIVLLLLAMGMFAFDHISGLRKPASAPAVPVVRTSLPVVAVLPLQALSSGDEGIFLASGLHDDLITRLARLQAFRVISRTSVMEYANSSKNLRQIGQELGAGYILEGGLQALGGRVRINSQLIDAASDEHLWAQTFDRELTTANLFDVQAEIATAIAGALRAVLSTHDTEVLREVPTHNLKAYRAYLQGLAQAGILTRPALHTSVAAFQRAVALDPDFAEAWAQLARSRIAQYWEEGGEYDASPDPTLLKASAAALQRAQALKPVGVATLVAESYYRYYGFRDYPAALIVLGRAEAIAPNHLQVVALRGYLLRRLGRFDQAADVLLRARKIGPNMKALLRETITTLQAAARCPEASTLATRALARYPDDSGIIDATAWVNLGCNRDMAAVLKLVSGITITTRAELTDVVALMIQAGDPGAAIQVLEEMDAPWVQAPSVGLMMANSLTWLYRHSGQNALADQALRTATAASRQITEPGAEALGELTMTAALAGDAEKTLSLGRRALASLPNDAFLRGAFRYSIVMAYATVGVTDEALSQLEIMLGEPRGGRFVPVLSNPYLASLRGDPRFQRLVKP